MNNHVGVCQCNYQSADSDKIFPCPDEKVAYSKAADIIIGFNILDSVYDKKISEAYHARKYKKVWRLWCDYSREWDIEETISISGTLGIAKYLSGITFPCDLIFESVETNKYCLVPLPKNAKKARKVLSGIADVLDMIFRGKE
jgi:hypothetical protein